MPKKSSKKANNNSGNRNKKLRNSKVLSSSSSKLHNADGPSIQPFRTTTGVLFMKLGFICLNLPGHLNPMIALARQLQTRNHEVVFLYSSGAAGLPFVPSDEKDQINENRPE